MTTHATHAHSAFLLAAFLLPAFAGACSNDSDEPEDERPPPVGVNRPPIVQGERTANTDEDVPIVVSLLDVAAAQLLERRSGVDLQLRDCEGIAVGVGDAVELEGDTLVYTPAAGFVGVESLTYTVADAHGATATATAHFGVGTVPPGMPRETIAIAGADLQHGFRAPSSPRTTTATSTSMSTIASPAS